MNNEIFWSFSEKYFRIIAKQFYKNIHLVKQFHKYLALFYMRIITVILQIFKIYIVFLKLIEGHYEFSIIMNYANVLFIVILHTIFYAYNNYLIN